MGAGIEQRRDDAGRALGRGGGAVRGSGGAGRRRCCFLPGRRGSGNPRGGAGGSHHPRSRSTPDGSAGAAQYSLTWPTPSAPGRWGSGVERPGTARAAEHLVSGGGRSGVRRFLAQIFRHLEMRVRVRVGRPVRRTRHVRPGIPGTRAAERGGFRRTSVLRASGPTRTGAPTMSEYLLPAMAPPRPGTARSPSPLHPATCPSRPRRRRPRTRRPAGPHRRCTVRPRPAPHTTPSRRAVPRRPCSWRSEPKASRPSTDKEALTDTFVRWAARAERARWRRRDTSRTGRPVRRRCRAGVVRGRCPAAEARGYGRRARVRERCPAAAVRGHGVTAEVRGRSLVAEARRHGRTAGARTLRPGGRSARTWADGRDPRTRQGGRITGVRVAVMTLASSIAGAAATARNHTRPSSSAVRLGQSAQCHGRSVGAGAEELVQRVGEEVPVAWLVQGTNGPSGRPSQAPFRVPSGAVRRTGPDGRRRSPRTPLPRAAPPRSPAAR